MFDAQVLPAKVRGMVTAWGLGLPLLVRCQRERSPPKEAKEENLECEPDKSSGRGQLLVWRKAWVNKEKCLRLVCDFESLGKAGAGTELEA